MIRRLAAPLPLAGLLLASLVVAGPVQAKEGMQARLDAPILADTPPGTTIEVGWTAVVPTGEGNAVVPFTGAPVFIALRSPGAGEPGQVVFGEESPSGSGHYVASITIPAGGIAPDGVTIGLRGESCVDGACSRSDLPFELVGAVLTSTTLVPPVAASAAPVVAPGPAPAEPATDRTPWLAIAAVGAALAIAGLLAGVRHGRPRAAVVATGRVAADVPLATE